MSWLPQSPQPAMMMILETTKAEPKFKLLKVFTNEKRGGLRVMSFHRPPSHPVRGIKPLSVHLFLLFANNY
jgi:hypothetical protein